MKIISEEKLQDLAYELYKIDWKDSHISTERKLGAYREYEYTGAIDRDEDYTFEDWLFDNGYDGEIYAYFGEFLECEYQDEEYMRYLLGNSVFWKAYKEYQG